MFGSQLTPTLGCAGQLSSDKMDDTYNEDDAFVESSSDDEVANEPNEGGANEKRQNGECSNDKMKRETAEDKIFSKQANEYVSKGKQKLLVVTTNAAGKTIIKADPKSLNKLNEKPI
jgi:hypothetical protein